MNDTTPEIEEKMSDMIMARSGSERMVMAASMFDAARAMVIASFPNGLADDELKRRLCERTYGVRLEDFLKGDGVPE
jgi:hypothetical protein